jgi:cytokinin riboside 5'-monophosphate phosphoribohydrolase
VRITTYTSSAPNVDARYHDVARAYAQRLAGRGDTLVYGGTSGGTMGTLAATVRDTGGHVTGIVPRFMHDRGLSHPACHELVVVDGMSDRKREMIGRADAFVALPGGFGTLEELLEVLTLKMLGQHDRAIVVVSLDGYWEPLFAMFERMAEQGFAFGDYRDLAHVTDDLDDLFHHLDTYAPDDVPTRFE